MVIASAIGTATGTQLATRDDGTVLPGNSPFVFHDLTSNDFMLGLRWKLGEPVAPPPPLVRKG